MSENVQITPGSGVTIGADSVVDVTLGSAQIQYIKIMDGTIGGTNKVAVTSNGLAIDGSGVTQPISAISLPLPTGASTSANQTTEISYLSTIATNTTNAGTPTVSGTVTVLQPTAANLNATVSQTIAGNLITESWINDGSGNAISSTSGSLDVFVSNFPATQPVSGTVAVTQSTSPWVVSLASTTITGTVAVTQSGVWSTGRTWTLANGTDSISSWLSDGSGNPITSTTGSLNVNVTNASGLDTVNQGNPNTLANAWPVELSDGTNLLGTPANPVRVDPTGTTNQPVSVTNFPTTQVVAQADQNITGTIAAAAGTVTLPLVFGAGSCEIYISGTFSATLNVQGTVDNLNWSSLQTATGGTALYAATAFSATGKYRVFRTSALTGVRVIATTYTSGTINVVINAAAPTGVVEVVQQTAGNLQVTATPPALPASAGFGQFAIAVTGTAIQLPSTPLFNGVVVTANVSNTANLTVGTSSVTNTTNGSGNGYILAPGGSVGIAAANMNSIWVNGTAADVVSFVGS